MEAWSSLKSTGRKLIDRIWTWQKTSHKIPADIWVQTITDFRLDFVGFVSLHSSSRKRKDLNFQIKCKDYLNLKRGLWTTEQQFFFPAQVRCFSCLRLRSGLISGSQQLQFFSLRRRVRGGSWCTDASINPLLLHQGLNIYRDDHHTCPSTHLSIEMFVPFSSLLSTFTVN